MPFGFGRGRRKRGGGGQGRGFCGGAGGWGRGPRGFAGPPANCICPQCGAVVPHRRGSPCFQTKCLQCGSFMTRQFLPEEET